LKGIVFKGHVENPLAKKLVKSGVLSAVSCSTWLDKKPVNQSLKIGKNYIFTELSLVRVPACDKCFIFHKEQLSKLTGEKDLKITESLKFDRGEKNMTEIETLSEIEEEEELMDLEELEEPTLYAILELPDEESLENLRRSKKIVSYYYGYPSYAPYGYKYPSPYKYPYKYPYRYKEKGSLEETPIIAAILQLDSKEELEELRQIYKVRRAYYGYRGYPYPNGYSYRYPYKYKYKYKYPTYGKLSEKLSVQDRTVGKPLEDYEEYKPKEIRSVEPAPNPENTSALTCPVCDKDFKDNEAFMQHWKEEHEKEYGPFKETKTILEALGCIVDLSKGDTKIIKSKAGRFIVFVDTGETGFGQWKIVGNFATRKEAEEAAKKAKLAKEEKEETAKDKWGCIVGKEKWDPEQKKCIPVSEEEMSKYTDFMAQCRKEGKSMKDCAEEWRKREETLAVICPACKEEFENEKALAKHWAEKHQEAYGPLKKAYKYPEKKSLAYYYYKYRGRYYPYYYKDGKYYTKYPYKKKKRKAKKK